MLWLASIVVSCLLVMDADIPDVPPILHLRPKTGPIVEFPPGQSLPILPELSGNPGQTKPDRKATLQPQLRMAQVRFVSGELARALKPLPGGKKGFRMKAGEPLNEKTLQQEIAGGGTAVHAGDTVQLTRMEFRDREIVIDLNGGGHRKTRLRDRIHIEMSGAPMPTATTSSSNAEPGLQPAVGSTIYLDFGRPLPDMTPDELKKYLGSVLDFSKQRS